MKFLVIRDLTEVQAKAIRNLRNRLKGRMGKGGHDLSGKWIFRKTKASKTDHRILGRFSTKHDDD